MSKLVNDVKRPLPDYVKESIQERVRELLSIAKEAAKDMDSRCMNPAAKERKLA